MASTEERLARVEEKVDEHSRGLSEVRDSIRHLEQRFDSRFQHLEQRVDVRFDVLEQRYSSMINAQMVTLAAIIGGFVAVIASLLSR